MRAASWTASRVLACCLATGAIASCGFDVGSQTAPPESPSDAASITGPSNEPDHLLDELAAAASEHAIPSRPLLLIINETSRVVVLTSADGRGAATVHPGKSLQLGSERVCSWIPLSASTEDGQLIEQYTEPCRGQTWTITDN